MEIKKKFTDHILEIHLSSDEDEFKRSILLDDFYNNMPENVQIDLKKVLSKFYFTQRQKFGWTCKHDGCPVQSCYSHEISENAFLKNIANSNSQVVVFKRNIRDSPAFFVESRVHKRDASNFPGYCSPHDAEIFKDIENGEPELTDYFINKQCLRTTRREWFETEAQIRTANDFIDSIPAELIQIQEVNEAIGRILGKISLLEKRLTRLISAYNNIHDGLKNSQHAIYHIDIDVSRPGYFFTTLADLTRDEDNQPCMLFIYKLDFKESAKVIICSLKNDISSIVAKEFSDDFPNTFLDVIYDQKERLIFSQEILASLSDGAKKILRRDRELYELTALDRLVLRGELL